MANCLWKHELVPLDKVREIYQNQPDVIMTSIGCWSRKKSSIVPIRELECMIRWDGSYFGPLYEYLPVSHVILEDNGQIILYRSEGYPDPDGDLFEIRNFSSAEEAEAYVKAEAFVKGRLSVSF